MDRRDFLRAAPALAAIASGTAAKPGPQGLHLSMDADSPFYARPLAVRPIGVTLDGESVAGCVEASEPDGFVIQSVGYHRKNTHLLRAPGAVMIPANDQHGVRVKRFGQVRISLGGA